MPQPTNTVLTLRPDLAGAMEEFPAEMASLGLIAYEACPIVNVGVQADQFAKIPIETYLQQQKTQRMSNGNYSRDDFDFEMDQFSTVEHGLEGIVDDRDAKRYANFFDAELIQVRRKRLQIAMAAEKRVADLLFNAGTFSGQTTGVTNEWDDFANATPVTDVELAAQAFYNKTGLWPNRLIMGRKPFRNLRNCAQIVSRISSLGAGDRSLATDINAEKLAQVFDIQKVLVGGMATNTANKGLAASIASIWSDEYALLAYIDESPDIEAPSLCKTFHWTEDGSVLGGLIESYREEAQRRTIVRVRHETHEKITMPTLGWLLSNITT
jgi:hypothetical protein